MGGVLRDVCRSFKLAQCINMRKFLRTKFDVQKKILETDRFIIRPWHKEDVNDLYEYARVDGVGQMAGWRPHQDLEVSESVLFYYIINRSVYALELKSKNKVIGSIAVEEMYMDYLDDSFNGLKGRELSYVLSKDYWGQGLMPEAVNKVIDYLFNELDFDFLLCGHFVSNVQSKRVIEKSGFEFYKEIRVATIFKTTEKTHLYIKYNPKLKK